MSAVLAASWPFAACSGAPLSWGGHESDLLDPWGLVRRAGVEAFTLILNRAFPWPVLCSFVAGG